MRNSYDVKNWYWLVAGDSGQVWSSGRAAYVAADDDAYRAWLGAGNAPTRIDTEANLKDVFAQQFPSGWPGLGDEMAARAALAASDLTILRCTENGVPVPEAWAAYRHTLRAIAARTQTGPVPTRPDYPAGT